jgi:hypothetical protein
VLVPVPEFIERGPATEDSGTAELIIEAKISNAIPVVERSLNLGVQLAVGVDLLSDDRCFQRIGADLPKAEFKGFRYPLFYKTRIIIVSILNRLCASKSDKEGYIGALMRAR